MSEVHERNVIWSIGLSFLTFGIYMFWWLYHLHQEIEAVTSTRPELRIPPMMRGSRYGASSGPGPGMVVFLCIITAGIYQAYWAWQQGVKFREEAQARGSREADNCPSLYLILQLFNYLTGITVVFDLALMQDRLNQLLRRRGQGIRPYDPHRFNHAPEADIARRYQERAQEWVDVTLEESPNDNGGDSYEIQPKEQ